MSNRVYYKIKIKNWAKYNGTRKSGHRNVMISERFFDDAKIKCLTPVNRLLFLSCILVCAQFNQGEAEVDPKLLSSQSGVKPGLIQSSLEQLQSLQLLSFEKFEHLINSKRREPKSKRREEQQVVQEKVPAGSKKTRRQPPDDDQEPLFTSEKPTSSESPKTEVVVEGLNKRIWESYRQAYLTRYKVDPARNATVNTQISQLGKRLGEEAVEVIAFYLGSNNGYYVQRCHPVGACLSDAESLRTQWLRGRAITRNDVKDFEKADKFNTLINDIREKGI